MNDTLFGKIISAQENPIPEWQEHQAEVGVIIGEYGYSFYYETLRQFKEIVRQCLFEAVNITRIFTDV